MRHKLTTTALLALLLALTLAVPALAGNTGCPIEISARLTDPTLDHSQGMTFIIVPGDLRDEHSFYGHTGTTKRAAPADPAPTASTFEDAVADLIAWLGGKGVTSGNLEGIMEAMDIYRAAMVDEPSHIAGIYGLINAPLDADGTYYGTSTFVDRMGNELQYRFNSTDSTFVLALVVN